MGRRTNYCVVMRMSVYQMCVTLDRKSGVVISLGSDCPTKKHFQYPNLADVQVTARIFISVLAFTWSSNRIVFCIMQRIYEEKTCLSLSVSLRLGRF